LTHYRALAYVLGQFLLALAGTMLVPLGFALWESGDGLRPLAYGVAATLIAGGLMVALFRRHARQLSRREGVLLVVGTWVSVCFFGSLPFLFSSYFSGLTDAFFESVSGFTTTGATVLDQVEILPRPLQFWRCFTHWLGGMGIVLLGVAILPLLGHGGMELYRAEFSGAKSEKLKPRIAESARSLWKIYFALSVVEFAALRWAGMNSFEALCHTFSTLGTGGFSTRTASIAGFNSPAIEFIILMFMLLAGMSFIQHYRLWVERRPRNVLSDAETRNYVAIFVTASIVICLILIGSSGYAPAKALRSSFFQVGSILTTTGFVTDDFEAWVPLPQLILLALMFVGGCTGSTAGGLKIMRIVLLPRVVNREFKRMIERRGVFAVRLNGHAMQESTIQSLLNLVYIAFVVNLVSCCLLTAAGVDVLTSIAAVAASMFNIGPGLRGVGPLENYATLPALAKWVLTACMIAGRLEFYTVLVIFTPSFWRK
jgi:trk system potassium uptake protein TrkH